MQKPTKRHHTQEMLSYGEVIVYVESEHGINVRDYRNQLKTNSDLVNRYNEKVSKDKKITGDTQYSSQTYQNFEKWLQENNLPSSQKGDIPYLDYWHWVLHNQFEGVKGNEQYLGLRGILDRSKKSDRIHASRRRTIASLLGQ